MTKINLRYEGALAEDADKRDWSLWIPAAPGASSELTREVEARPGVTMSIYADDGARLTDAPWWPRYAGDAPGTTETAETFVLRQLAEAVERTHQRRRTI